MNIIKNILTSKNFKPIIFILICIVTVFYQVIFFGKTLTTGIVSEGVMATEESDNFQIAKGKEIINIIDRGGSAWQDEPQTIKVSNLYKNKSLPLWNKNAGFGKPLAADMMSMAFSIFRIPIFINTSTQIFDLMLFARILVGGLFMYLYLKKIKISIFPAAAGSVIYILSGYFIYYANMGHIYVELLIPMLFYSIELMFDKKTISNFILFILSIVLMIMGGHPESLVLAMIFATIYFFQKIIYTKKRKNGKKILVEKYFIGIIIAATLISFLLIPFFEYYFNSDVGVHNSSYKLYSQSRPFYIFILQFFPILIKSSLESLTSNYFSLIILFLSIVGLFNKYQKITYRFFLTSLILSLIKVYSKFLFNWIQFIPIFNNFVYHKYLQPEISFSFAVLTAIGLDYLRKEVKFKKPFIVSLIAVIMVDIYLYFNLSKINYSYGPKHLWVGMIFPIFLLSIYYLLRILTNKIVLLKKSNVAFIFLCLISVFDLILFSPKDKPPRGDVYHKANYINFLDSDKNPFRIFSTDKIMYPATSSVFNIDDIRDLHAVYPRLYISYIKNFLDESITDRFSEYTETTNIFGNKFFDLTNTKYILSNRPLDINIDNTLTKKIIDQSNLDLNSSLTWFNINSDSKIVLFEHPPGKISYKFTPTSDKSILSFSIGLSPKVWDPKYGEGVSFQIYRLVGNNKITLYDKYIDPKNNVDDRKWFDDHIDLSTFINQEITLEFMTSVKDSNAYGWAGWGNLKLSSSTRDNRVKINDQFTQIYNDEILIYKNNKSFPRVFTVQNIILAHDEESSIKEMKNDSFDPQKTAVIIAKSNLLTKEANLNDDLSEEISYLTETDSELSLNTVTKEDSYLVISNIFYPGWEAYVDNQKVDIYQTNLAFNSLFLPKGNHRVIFKYNPISYKIGFAISVASLISFTTYLIIIHKNKK